MRATVPAERSETARVPPRPRGNPAYRCCCPQAPAAALPAPFSYTHRPGCSVPHGPAGSRVNLSIPQNSFAWVWLKMGSRARGCADARHGVPPPWPPRPARPAPRRSAPDPPTLDLSRPAYPRPAPPDPPTLDLSHLRPQPAYPRPACPSRPAYPRPRLPRPLLTSLL
jgi:hypothetical protein